MMKSGKYNIVINEVYGKILCYSICGLLYNHTNDLMISKRPEEGMTTRYDYLPKNADNFELSLSYERFNTMSITVSDRNWLYAETTKEETSETTTEPTTKETTTQAQTTNQNSEIDSTLKQYKGKRVSELISYLKDIGYSANFYAQNTGADFTSWLWDEPWTGDSYIIQEIKNINHSSKTMDVYWQGDVVVEEQEQNRSNEEILNDKLDEFVAWEAVAQYGKNIYGRKFKVHYIREKLAAKAEDADTWYLKAGCTLPAGQNLTVEAEVTGTDYSPQVIYFIVY